MTFASPASVAISSSRELLKSLAMAVLVFALCQLLETAVRMSLGLDITHLCSWDCRWYASIVEGGYDLVPHAHDRGDAANWAFFPAFPLLARWVSWSFGISSGLALVLTGKIFFLAAIAAFVIFASIYVPGMSRFSAAAVAALQPYALYGNTGYTEPMFLFFTCLFFIALKKNMFVQAGAAAGLLSSVRLVGLSAALVLAIAAFPKFASGDTERKMRIYVAMMLAPLGAALFAAYLYFITGDALAFLHVQIAWGREIGNPVRYLWESLQDDGAGRVYAIMSVYGLCCAGFLAWRGHTLLALSCLACICVPLSSGLISMPRYIWWQAPVLLATVMIFDRRWIWIVALVLSVADLAYNYHSWFTGRSYVV